MAEGSSIDRVSMIVLRSMRGPIFLLITVYAVGIAVFGLIPGVDGQPMSFFHALYFLSYTATTTGFGELPAAFSNAQRLWAIVLLHVSVIAWLYSIGAIIRLVQNQHFQRAWSRHVFARRVAGMDEPFAIICGFGDAGSLLARGLNEQALAAVIIDNDPDRIKALKLRNYVVRMLGVCDDSSDPRVLLDAGLQHPMCRGIVAVTDEEYVNMKTTVMTRVLNPDIRPICRVESRDRSDELEALGQVIVLDAFEIFADRLCSALRRPALHALGDWLVRKPGATLDIRQECPAGKWIICGYGQMGHRIEENLKDHGVEVITIDPEIPEADNSDRHIRGSANGETLAQAGIHDANCVIIATDSDTINLRIMMLVQNLNPDLFVVIRQNRYINEIVFTDAPVDIVMHPDRVIARRIQLELISSGLQPLLDHLETCPLADLEGLIDRLRDALGEQTPTLWTTRLDAEVAPALEGRRSQRRRIEPTLRDLMRSPRHRDTLVSSVPLILERKGSDMRLPDLDTPLEADDCILFCGTRQARNSLAAVLKNPYTLEFLVSGEEPPRSYLVRYLQLRLEQSSQSSGE